MLLKDRLANTGLHIMWNWTCVSPSQEPTFRALLKRIKPRRAVEIGTHQGLSAALLAEYANEVHTVDVLPNPARKVVWGTLGVTEKIIQHVHKSSAGRDSAIQAGLVGADLVFIDGSHLMPDVIHDFELVSFVSGLKVIFHDYWASNEDWPDVKQFVDGLARQKDKYVVEIHKPFAYVEVL